MNLLKTNVGFVATICNAIVFFALNGLIGAMPVYFLWNLFIPEIFGINTITFWQAWAMLFLSGMLFKNAPKI